MAYSNTNCSLSIVIQPSDIIINIYTLQMLQKEEIMRLEAVENVELNEENWPN